VARVHPHLPAAVTYRQVPVTLYVVSESSLDELAKEQTPLARTLFTILLRSFVASCIPLLSGATTDPRHHVICVAVALVTGGGSVVAGVLAFLDAQRTKQRIERLKRCSIPLPSAAA
jgi:hypothetical protein